MRIHLHQRNPIPSHFIYILARLHAYELTVARKFLQYMLHPAFPGTSKFKVMVGRHILDHITLRPDANAPPPPKKKEIDKM
jgi:hypothetical protein